MQLLKSIRRVSRGIAFRYAVVVAIVLFGFAILYTSIQIYSQREALLLNLRTQATDQASFLSAVIPESVYLRNFLNLETLMRQTNTVEAVVYAVVVDTDGRALTRYLKSDDPFVAQALAQANGNFAILDLIGSVRADAEVEEVRSPVISEGLLLGEVWLGYTTASIQKELVRTVQNTVGGALLSGLFLSLLTAVLFNWQVRHPLQAVIDSSQALAAGDLESRVIISRRDELGSLGAAFNAMADRLQTTLDGLRTANQSLLSSEARTRSIVTTAAEGIITIDGQGVIESFNPAAARIFGYLSDEVVGQNVNILMPELYRSQHDGYLTAYLTTGVKKVIGIGHEVKGRHKDGTLFPISLSVSELSVDGQRLFTGIVSDTSERKQIADALRVAAEQNQLLAQAVEAVSDGILITDSRQPDNPILYANPAFFHITGYPIEEVLGRNCRFLQGPETDQQQLTQLRRAIAEKRSTTVTLLNYRKDGTRFLNELSISPVVSQGGTLTHFVGIQTDISERRKLAETLQAVLNTVAEGIVTANDSGIIMMVNPEIQRIFGYRTEELLGQSLAMLMSVGYRDAQQAGMARYLSSGIPHVLGKRRELEGLRKNGEIFPLEIYISETRIAEQHLFTASIRDITQRKEYDRMRDDFVSTVSHELRTPLASVMGWTETLLSGKPGSLTDLQKRFLEIVYDSSGRLNRLIEEILTVSSIQGSTLQLNRKEFSPRESMAGVGEMLKSVAEPKGIEIDYQEEWPPNVRLLGDPNRVEQVLTNLIGNAIKFSPNGGTVTVKSTQEDGCWRVIVRDQGIGIPTAELPHLFERFYRASTANEAQIQGTGLGLYVCKAIVEGHGGEIGVESVQNEGTTVWFTLPA